MEAEWVNFGLFSCACICAIREFEVEVIGTFVANCPVGNWQLSVRKFKFLPFL